MPLYDYRCSQCGHLTEVRHGFNDTYDAPCAACGGAVRRVFNPAPILFKGSGFYVTDSRTSGESGKSEAPKADAAKADTPKTDAPKADAPKAGKPASGESAA